MLSFARHLAGLPRQAHLDQVRGCHEEIRRLGAEVLAVSFVPAERLPEYRLRHGWPFPAVWDLGREAYRAFGLGSAGWAGLLTPWIEARDACLMLRTDRSRPSGADVRQLGGDFVLEATRRVVTALVSAVASAATWGGAGGTS